MGAGLVMLGRPFPQHLLDRRIDQRLPLVVLLPAQEFVGVEPGVITAAAGLEIVEVVGDQVGMDAPACRISVMAEVSNGSSGPQERCMKLGRPVCRSRRAGMQGSEPAVMAVEGDAAGSQAIEVRRLDAGVAAA